jgi:hypothetical protein
MTHEKDRDREDFETRTREVFERSVADLDGATRSKLTQARHRALQELERPATERQWLAWRPQAAAAALVVVAVGAGWLFIDSPAPLSPVDAIAEVSDFELLLGEDDLELIEELEFYAWLEEQPEFQASDDGGAG